MVRIRRARLILAPLDAGPAPFQPPDGWAVRARAVAPLPGWLLHDGAEGYRLAEAGGVMTDLIPRRVEAALDALAAATASPEAALAARLRGWRKARGLNTAAAGELLGVSGRMVEYIEAGRGFRYPRLLTLALERLDEI